MSMMNNMLLHSKPLAFPLLLAFFHIVQLSFSINLCTSHESTALLRIKNSFLIDKYSFSPSNSHAKVKSWKPKTNCCQWDGVLCDPLGTGHVVSLDLSSSRLFGRIEPDSTLFSLKHLRKLNLAHNNFNSSQIPSGFGQLLSLTHLNLSNSRFSGDIPIEISQLVNLISLDLSSSSHQYSPPSWFSLKLQNLSLHKFIRNMTGLRELHLDHVNISSPITPDTFGNLNSLVSLHLQSCQLYGEFPGNIFHLPMLEVLNVRDNGGLTGHMPEFQQGSPLVFLDLSSTNFSGRLPNSISNLKFLTHLYLSDCNFSMSMPHQISQLTNLVVLDLRRNALNGSVPSSLFALPYLSYLDLSENHLTGRLDDFKFVSSSSSLESISLSNNKLYGEIPKSISNLVNLTKLTLSSNKLNGTVQVGIFSTLQKLVDLHLSYNSLTLILEDNFSSTFPKFRKVGLSSCNISEFPEFLRNQEALEELDLSDNRIDGKIPRWVWNTWRETLVVLNISHNALIGFEDLPAVIPWDKAKQLDFHSNMLQGSVPIPATQTFFFSVSDNNLTGEIPLSICKVNSLAFLDLSNNSLSGLIPKCLGHSSNSLAVLDLGMNNFIGEIPNTFMEGNSLRTLDLRENKLQGQMPRSLVNCTKLEVLNLGDNQIEDSFPFWLETLPELQVLVLRSNKFHGEIGHPKASLPFSKLRIICMGHNDFTGNLPSGYFQSFRAMMMMDDDHKHQLEYMGGRYYLDSVTLISKGIEMVLVKILTSFKAADFSDNNFQGGIPDSVGNLRSVHVLNFSSNNLTESIPSSLGNLQMLESLDLSCNNLTGKIPPELTNLTFLEVLDLSQNQLTGLIPRGKQFETFQNTSYSGNTGLCGFPLSKKTCGDDKAAEPPSQKNQLGLISPSDQFDWKDILLGYGFGLIVGLVIGHIIFRNKDRWFVKALARVARTQEKYRQKKRTVKP